MNGCIYPALKKPLFFYIKKNFYKKIKLFSCDNLFFLRSCYIKYLYKEI